MIPSIVRELWRRASSQRGASAVEYGLLIAGIAAVVVIAVYAFGGTVAGIFEDTNTCIENSGVGC